MQMATSIETENGEMIVKRVSVPIGLEELMEGLTKEVMLKKPKDIYVFASEYFAHLLDLRDRGNFKNGPVRRVSSITQQMQKNPDHKRYGDRKSKSVDTGGTTASNTTNGETSYLKKQSTPVLKGTQIRPVLDKNKARKSFNIKTQRIQESRDQTLRASLDEGQLGGPKRSTSVGQLNKVRSLQEKVKTPRNKNQILTQSRNKMKTGSHLQKSEEQAREQKPQDIHAQKNLEIVPTAALNELTTTEEHGKEHDVDTTLRTGDPAIQQRTEELLHTLNSNNNVGKTLPRSDVQTAEELQSVTLDDVKKKHKNPDEATGETQGTDEGMAIDRNSRAELNEVLHEETSTEEAKLDTTEETSSEDRTEREGYVKDNFKEKSKQTSEESERAASLIDGKSSQLEDNVVAKGKSENKEMVKQKSPEASMSGVGNETGDFVGDETASNMGKAAEDLSKNVTESNLDKTAEEGGSPNNEDEGIDMKSGTEIKAVTEINIPVASRIARIESQRDITKADDGNKEKGDQRMIDGETQLSALGDVNISGGEEQTLQEEKERINSSKEQVIAQLDSQVPEVETHETKNGEIETFQRDERRPTSKGSFFQEATDVGGHNSMVTTRSINGESEDLTTEKLSKIAHGSPGVSESSIKKEMSVEDNASVGNTDKESDIQTGVDQVETNWKNAEDSINSAEPLAIGRKDSEQRGSSVKGEILINNKANGIQTISNVTTTEMTDKGTDTKTFSTVSDGTKNDTKLQSKEGIKIQNTRTKSLSQRNLDTRNQEIRNKTKIRRTSSVDSNRMSEMMKEGNNRLKSRHGSSVILRSEQKLDKGTRNVGGSLEHNNIADETNKSGDIAKLAHAAIKIQSMWRGYKSRKTLTKKETQHQTAETHDDQTSDKQNEESSEKNVPKLVEAVIKLQALWRGFSIRKRMKNNNLFGHRVESFPNVTESLKTPAEIQQRQANDAALKVQALWKGYKVRKNLKEAKERPGGLDEATKNDDSTSSSALTDQDLTKAAIKIQSGVRGYMVRKKFNINQLKSISEETLTHANKMSDEQSSSSSDEVKQIVGDDPAETQLIGRSLTVDEPEMIKKVNNVHLAQTEIADSVIPTENESGARSDFLSNDFNERKSDAENFNLQADTEHQMDRKVESRMSGSIKNHSLTEVSDEIDNKQEQLPEKVDTGSMDESNLSVASTETDGSKNDSLSESDPVIKAESIDTHLDVQQLASDSTPASNETQNIIQGNGSINTLNDSEMNTANKTRTSEAQNNIQGNGSTDTLNDSEMSTANKTKTDEMEHMKEESRPLSLESTTSNDSAVTVIVKSNPAHRDNDLDISDNESTKIENDSGGDSKNFSIEQLRKEIGEASESTESDNKSNPISSVDIYIGESGSSGAAKIAGVNERVSAKGEAILTGKISYVTRNSTQQNEDATNDNNDQSNGAKIVDNGVMNESQNEKHDNSARSISVKSTSEINEGNDSDKLRTDSETHVSGDRITEDANAKFPTDTTNVLIKSTLEGTETRRKRGVQNGLIPKNGENDMVNKQDISTTDMHLAEGKKEMKQNKNEELSCESNRNTELFETNSTQPTRATDRNREIQNDIKGESAKNIQDISVSETMPVRTDSKSGDEIMSNVGDKDAELGTEGEVVNLTEKKTDENKEGLGSETNENQESSENNEASVNNDSNGSPKISSTQTVLGYVMLDELESHLQKHIDNDESETSGEKPMKTGSFPDKPGYKGIPEKLFAENEVDKGIESVVVTDHAHTLSACEKNELGDYRGNAEKNGSILKSNNDEKTIQMPDEKLSRTSEANQTRTKDSSELNNEPDSSSHQQTDAQGYVAENDDKKDVTTEVAPENDNGNRNRITDHSNYNNIVEDSKKEEDQPDSNDQNQANEGTIEENDKTGVEDQEQGVLNSQQISNITKGMIPHTEAKSGNKDLEVSSECEKNVQNQTRQTNGPDDKSLNSTKDVHDVDHAVKVSFSIGNHEIALNEPTQLSEDNQLKTDERKVINVRSEPDSLIDEQKQNNNNYNSPAKVERHEMSSDGTNIQQEENQANTDTLGTEEPTESRKLTGKTRTSIDLAKLDEEVKNRVESYNLNHQNRNRTADSVLQNEDVATTPKELEALARSVLQTRHKEAEDSNDNALEQEVRELRLDDNRNADEKTAKNHELNFERRADLDKQFSDKKNDKIDLRNLRDEVANHVGKSNKSEDSNASAPLSSRDVAATKIQSLFRGYHSRKCNKPKETDNLSGRTSAEDPYISQEIEEDENASRKLGKNLDESEVDQSETNRSEKVNDVREEAIERDENTEEKLPDQNMFSDETVLNTTETGQHKVTNLEKTKKNVDSITTGENGPQNDRELNTTTTALVHPSEFHDTVTIPIKPDSPLTQVQAVQQGSPSKTTSPGLVHTGELHDNVFPVSIQLNQVPPAGAQVLTSPRRSSDDGDGDQNSIVDSVIIDARDNVGGGSVEAQASNKDASAQKHNSTTTCAMDDADSNVPQSQTESEESVGVDSTTTDERSSSQNSSVISSTKGDIIGNITGNNMDREKRNNAASVPTAAAVKNKNMEAEAATKIQAGFRGYQVRKQLKNKITSPGDVSSPRRSLRRKNSGRLADPNRMNQTKAKNADELEEKSAVKIQAGVRGFLVRRRQKKQKVTSDSS